MLYWHRWGEAGGRAGGGGGSLYFQENFCQISYQWEKIYVENVKYTGTRKFPSLGSILSSNVPNPCKARKKMQKSAFLRDFSLVILKGTSTLTTN